MVGVEFITDEQLRNERNAKPRRSLSSHCKNNYHCYCNQKWKKRDKTIGTCECWCHDPNGGVRGAYRT
jgi:hypothetical protein